MSVVPITEAHFGGRLVLGTNIVSLDEPCFLLCDRNLQGPGNRGWRRYRLLWVIRNDRPALMRIDLGPEECFADIGLFNIPGGVMDETTGRGECLHTVGQLIDMANWASEAEPPEPPNPVDWKAAYHDTMDARKRRRRGRRQFGHTAKGR